MEILSVALKNFKSHSDRYFEFQPGTNAICGENGAGKTSILEAIAWTLFNYSSYQQNELIKTGSASAQVTVSFLSELDGRPYEVRRSTGRGYEIYDPDLKVNLGLKKLEDVTAWLRQHMGVPAETELAKLFAETIGIPQGTFTSDFLKSKTERKKVFDPILKVEEYKQAYERTSNLERYARFQVEGLTQALEQYEHQLADSNELKQQHTHLTREIQQNEAQAQQLAQHLATLQQEKDQLHQQAEHLQQLATQVQQLAAQIAGKQESQQILEQSLVQAQQAVERCDRHRQNYEQYQHAAALLTTLEQQLQQQQQLLRQREGYQQTLNDRQVQLSQVQVRLEGLTHAEQEMVRLAPLVDQQTALEQQQADVTKALQEISLCRWQHQQDTQLLQQQQQQLRSVMQQIQALRDLEPQVQQIPELEVQRDRCREQLSRIEAARQFEAELQQIVAQAQQKRDRQVEQVAAAIPVLERLRSAVPEVDLALATVEAGIALNQDILAALTQILTDLSQQTAAEELAARLKTLQGQIDTAYQSRLQLSTLEAKLNEATRVQQSLQQLQQSLAQSQTQLNQEPVWQQQAHQSTAALAQLNNPRAQVQLLQQQLQQQPQLQADYDRQQQSLQQLQQTIQKLDQQLATFAQVQPEIIIQKQHQQTHAAGYQIYLQHETATRQFPQLQVQFASAIADLEVLKHEHEARQTQWQNAYQHFQPQRLAEVTALYEQTKTRKDQMAGGLPLKQEQLNALRHQLQIRQMIAQKRDAAQLELEAKQQIKQFISDARRIYDQSGPRITKFYLGEISREADRLFRELLNRPDVALEWTEDYEIRVQEEAHWRGFKSLSGGEQMCAALAVRLALLKVLANLNIAFFDEPTTNMDQARRTQLAEALTHLKTFQQLFVISHDDTFENITENIIRVQRSQ